MAQEAYNDGQAIFVTFCTQNRRRLLSGITVGAGLPARPEVRLSAVGHAVLRAIQFYTHAYPSLTIAPFVIMPDHVHFIVTGTGGPGGPPLRSLAGGIKTFTTRQYRKLGGSQILWQRGYYDHILRTEEDLLATGRYIKENPVRWLHGEYFDL